MMSSALNLVRFRWNELQILFPFAADACSRRFSLGLFLLAGLLGRKALMAVRRCGLGHVVTTLPIGSGVTHHAEHVIKGGLKTVVICGLFWLLKPFPLPSSLNIRRFAARSRSPTA